MCVEEVSGRGSLVRVVGDEFRMGSAEGEVWVSGGPGETAREISLAPDRGGVGSWEICVRRCEEDCDCELLPGFSASSMCVWGTIPGLPTIWISSRGLESVEELGWRRL